MEKAIEKIVKPSIVDIFLKGCGRGSKVGIESITPVMILGYTLVYTLQVTGLMTFPNRIFAPVMGVFGLLGEAFAVLISAFLAKASGCTTAATMHVDGALTLGQVSMLLPACILMGMPIGHYARIVLVARTNKKWHTLLLIIPLLNTTLLLIIMRVILAVVGITQGGRHE